MATKSEQQRIYRCRWLAKQAPDFEKNRALLKRYGIGSEERERLHKEQGFKCAICGAVATPPKWLDIDHDHITGEIRGVLCNSCNQGLGYFKDDPNLLTRAARYLEFGRRKRIME